MALRVWWIHHAYLRIKVICPTLAQHCRNVVQMFCVCWANTYLPPKELGIIDFIATAHNEHNVSPLQIIPRTFETYVDWVMA